MVIYLIYRIVSSARLTLDTKRFDADLVIKVEMDCENESPESERKSIYSSISRSDRWCFATMRVQTGEGMRNIFPFDAFHTHKY